MAGRRCVRSRVPGATEWRRKRVTRQVARNVRYALAASAAVKPSVRSPSRSTVGIRPATSARWL